MARTIQTTVYQYSELSEKAKENARDRFRDGGLYYDWWDCVYENAKQCATILGIEIENIWFSGFSSQGDGACFEGGYRYAKGALKAIKYHAPLDTDLRSIAKQLQGLQKGEFYQLTAKCSLRYRGCHSGCMGVSVDRYDSKPFAQSDADEQLQDILREFADWIYKQLENEYDWLNSDEHVVEIIEANKYEFLENGKMA